MLRPETEKLWQRLREERLLDGFVLAGGTALAMHIDHRLSEDLDFMYPDMKLPRERLTALRRKLAAEGFELTANDSPIGVEAFSESGLDYHDYQQDYMVNGLVKLTFVAPEPENAKQLEHIEASGPRVASIQEIFGLKCIVAADRSKSRDWFDLYTLLKSGIFQPFDIYRAFARSGVPGKFDIAMMRLCSGKPSETDEGYEALLPNPPSIKEMSEYFKVVRDEAERAIAAAQVREMLAKAKPLGSMASGSTPPPAGRTRPKPPRV